MGNFTTTVKDGKLVIEIDLKQDQGKSKSGKNTLVASSNGNIPLPEPYQRWRLGLNLFKPNNE